MKHTVLHEARHLDFGSQGAVVFLVGSERDEGHASLLLYNFLKSFEKDSERRVYREILQVFVCDVTLERRLTTRWMDTLRYRRITVSLFTNSEHHGV